MNTRKLGDQVVRDEEGQIVSDRKRETKNCRLDCKVKYKLSYLLVNKGDDSERRHWVGRWTHSIHTEDHTVPKDPFDIGHHRKETTAYKRVVQAARIYCQCKLPYSQACKLLDTANMGVRIKASDYYNLVRNDTFNRSDPKSA